MATFQSSNPFLPGGPGMTIPIRPNLNIGANGPGTSGTVQYLQNVAPTIPKLPLAQSGSTTSGAAPMNLSIQPKPATPSPFASFGAAPAIPSLGVANSTPSVMPNSPFKPTTYPPAVPNLPAPVTTPSGNVVQPATGGIVAPPQGQSPAMPNVGQPPAQPPTASPAAFPTDPGAVAGAGATTTIPSTANPADPLSSPLFTSPAYEAAAKAYQDAQRLSPEEIQNQTDVNNLQDSLRKAYTNTEGQSIPLEFITGQQRRLQQSEAGLEQPLQAKAALLQGQRVASIEASKFALDTEAGKLSALRDYTKPVATPFGGTLTRYNTQTGQYEQVGGGAFGTGTSGTSGSGAGGAFDPNSVVDQYTQQYMNTGELPPRFAMNPQAAAVIYARANELSMAQTGSPYNPSTTQANIKSASSALTDLNGRLANSQAALPTIQQNGRLILQGMQKAGINQSDVPIINQMSTAAKRGTGISTGDIAAFRNSLTTLRNEYARLLMGKGQTTDKATSDADSALPDDISPSALGVVLDRITAEGQNVIGGLQGEIANQKKSLTPYDFSTPKSNFGGSSSGGGSGSIYNF